jgi:hypothetical protein
MKQGISLLSERLLASEGIFHMDLGKEGKNENGKKKSFTLNVESVSVYDTPAQQPTYHTDVTPNTGALKHRGS